MEDLKKDALFKRQGEAEVRLRLTPANGIRCEFKGGFAKVSPEQGPIAVAEAAKSDNDALDDINLLQRYFSD